ncbi:MAG: hypothetical protein AOA66_0472 [Candidatus Bathyarchaeota archaeon BA2]|nr:MAG: hypothetical protein AOA66_0472 [Candidatus Bathyarchaeota archaeon BA2]
MRKKEYRSPRNGTIGNHLKYNGGDFLISAYILAKVETGKR